MPEIKHTFTAGKMNKDLDERLVKNGEYRDALNIQVRTSNDGASGTIQNIKGNSTVGETYYAEWMSEPANNWENPNDYSQYPRCLASVADEKNNKAYFFFASTTHPPVLATSPQMQNKRRLYIDTIIEQNVDSDVTTPIVVDHFGTIDTIRGVLGTTNYFDNEINNFDGEGWTEIPVEDTSYYRVDMTVRVLDTDGVDIIEPGKIKAIDTVNNVLLLHEPMYGNINLGGVWFLFEADRVLNFSQGELLSNASPHNIITGINIVDKFLMWTDNYSEPKKINIERCRKGSNPSNAAQNGRTHTKLYVEDIDTNTLVEVSDVAHQINSDPTNSDLKEEHITVVKKSPRTAPTLEMSKWDRNEGIQNTVTVEYAFVDTGTNPTVLMGEEHTIQDSDLLQSDYIAGDILNFTELGDGDPDDTQVIKTQFISYIEGGGEMVDYVTDTIVVSVIASNTDVQSIDTTWGISIELEKPLFEFKFPRFGYRYKYEDNEYSTFSPWSEIAFLPDEFEYNPAKGYNLGMINTVRSLIVKDFIPYKIPLDVKAIDILFKTTDASNVYVVETIERTKDNEWVANSPDGQDTTLEIKTGKLKISSEMIHRMLDANQTLRTWDNVPRTALAQEIIGNRLVYGNYKQGYNIKGSVKLIPKVISEASPSINSPKKSIKTLRDYKIGVVYGDKYGRETPVLTSKYTISDSSGEDSTSLTAGLTIDKTLCAHQNKFEVSQNWDEADMIQNNWMDYVKYYVKETSNEYYNLIMDRWYDSGDGGTIWMSFNSADRNKVEEGDYLILKNQHGSEKPILEKARYKILAIKNEAPDFIKKTYMDLPQFPEETNLYGVSPQLTNSLIGVAGSVWYSTGFNDAADMWVGIQNEQAEGLYKTTSILIRQWEWRIANQGSFTTDNEGDSYTAQGDPFYGDTEVPADEHVEMRVVGQMMANNGGAITGEMKSHWRKISSRTYTSAGGGTVPFLRINWESKFDQLGDGGVDMLTRFNNAQEAGQPFNADAGLPNGLKYILEFRRVRTENKPEFDGKFFVKIEKDLLISQNVTVLGLNLEYQNSDSIDISYINSSWQNDTEQTAQANPTTGTTIDTEAVFDTSTEASDWFLGAYQGILGANDDPASFDQGGNGAPDYDDEFSYIMNNNWSSNTFAPDTFDGLFNNWEDSWGSQDWPDSATAPLAPSFSEIIQWPPLANCTSPYFTIYMGMYNQYMDISAMGSCYANDTYNGGQGSGGGENLVSRTKNFWVNWKNNVDRVFLDGASVAAGALCTAMSGTVDPAINQGGGGEGDGLFSPAGMPQYYPALQSYQGVEIGRGWKPFTFRTGVLAIPSVPNTFGATGGTYGSMTLSYATNSSEDAPQGVLAQLATEGQRFYWENDTGDGGDPYYYKVIGVVFSAENGGIINYWNEGYWDQIAPEEEGFIPPYYNTACEVAEQPSDNGSQKGSRRVTYRIEFRRIDKVTDALTTSGMNLSSFDPRAYLHHDGRDSIKLRLLDLVDVGGASGGDESPDAERGACWETEPKEDIDLELYYEASNAVPMVLNKSNAFDFAQPNSLVKVYRELSGVKKEMTLSGYTNVRLNNIHFTHNDSETAIMAIVGEDGNNDISLVNQSITIGDELEFLHPNDGIKTKAKVTKVYRPIDDSVNGAFTNITTQDLQSGIVSGPKAFEEITPVDYSVIPFDNEGETIYGFNINNVPPIGTYLTAFYASIDGINEIIPLPEGVEVSGYGANLYPAGIPVVIVLFTENGIANNDVLATAQQDWFNSLSEDQQASAVINQTTVQSIEPSGYYGIDINVWKNPVTLGWHNCWAFGNGVESDRVADDYNAPQIDNGVRVSTTFSGYQEENISSGLIYSGLYNSISEVNELNEFNQAEKITKQLNPRHGSIQRIKSRDTDAVIFTEDKVLKILANKDALFNADGNAQLTATDRVLGQVIPYAGEYGISKNPESLAWDQYRMYFTDMQRGAVLRLSKDGLTPISNVGMSDWFRNNLRGRQHLLGSFDVVNKEYNLSLKYDYSYLNTAIVNPNKTLSFSETTKGWVSFKSFIPSQALSVSGKYLSTKNHKIWKHHSAAVDRNSFYGEDLVPSQVTVMFNDNPSVVKSFRTMNYEGSQAKIESFNGVVQSVPTGEINFDVNDFALSPVTTDVNLNDGEYYNLFDRWGWWCPSCETDLQVGSGVMFKDKEGKWFAKVPKQPVLATYTGENNVDTSEITVQGIGTLSEDSIVTGIFEDDDTDGGDEETAAVLGCMDENSSNYNPNATLDDGSCLYGIVGCMDPADPWYTPNATINSSANCNGYYIGCMQTNAYNYNPSATQEGYCLAEDGTTVVPCNQNAYSWVAVEGYGCLYDTFEEDISNNDPDDEEGEVAEVYGCMDPLAGNFNPDATINQLSATDFTIPCNYYETITEIWGCMEEGACNYNPWANFEDGSCDYSTCAGCMDYSAFNFNPTAIISDPSACCYSYDECTESPDVYPEEEIFVEEEEVVDPIDQSNECPDGQIWVGGQDGGCEVIVYGCTDENSAAYNSLANVDDGTCVEPTAEPDYIYGCMDQASYNYNPEANIDDGSCIEIVWGCLNSGMFNYNPEATHDCNMMSAADWGWESFGPGLSGDESCCESFTFGCTDPTAFNYNPNVNTDDGSCQEIVYGCMDEDAGNYNPEANVSGYNAENLNSPCTYLDTILTYNEMTVQNDPDDSEAQTEEQD